MSGSKGRGSYAYTHDMFEQLRELCEGPARDALRDIALVQAEAVSEILKQPVGVCLRCLRVMLPRRLWMLLNKREGGRPRFMTVVGDPPEWQLCNWHANEERKAEPSKRAVPRTGIFSDEHIALLSQLAKGRIPK